MTPEDKELLIKDLCSRLRNRVWVKIGAFSDYTLVGYDSVKDTFTVELIDNHPLPHYIPDILAEDMKPYLRSMSSMAKEEMAEYSNLIQDFEDTYSGWQYLNLYDGYEYYDWLSAHHFDYRGLVKKGLALEAPEGMYK